MIDADAPLIADMTTEWLTPRQAAQRAPGNPGRAAVVRWIIQGVKVAGQRLKLPATKVGGRWAITAADLDAYIDALTDRAVGRKSARQLATRARRAAAAAERRRQRDHRRACRDLDVLLGRSIVDRAKGASHGRRDGVDGATGNGDRTVPDEQAVGVGRGRPADLPGG